MTNWRVEPSMDPKLIEAIDSLVDEINLIWSVLELPWYRRMRRMNRSWALRRLEKIND